LPASPGGAVVVGAVVVGGGAAVVEVGGLLEVGGSVCASAPPLEKTTPRTAVAARIEIRRERRPLPMSPSRPISRVLREPANGSSPLSYRPLIAGS
jgi:hypothetical protein